MKNARKILVMGDVPRIFITTLESLFRYFQMYFIDLDKERSGEGFRLRVYSIQPDFVMIRLEDYLKNQEFYDDLIKSFPRCIFWKIDTNKVWRANDIKSAIIKFKRKF